MEKSGRSVVLVAVAANFGIFLTKAVAAALSGSSAMLAEALHSLADTGNQILLYIGIKKSVKAEDEVHPFGYGKERYFWAFVVAIMLFFLGGGFSIYEGIERFLRPRKVSAEIFSLSILAICFVFELYSFLYVSKIIKERKGRRKLMEYLKETKQIELAVVFLEDLAAMLGLVIAFSFVLLHKLTSSVYFDSFGSILIGILLVWVAFFLAKETRSLLIGESPSKALLTAAEEILARGRGVEKVIYVKGLQLGAEYVLLTAKLAFNPEMKAREVADSIDEIERQLRQAFPELKRIFIETDIWRERR